MMFTSRHLCHHRDGVMINFNVMIILLSSSYLQDGKCRVLLQVGRQVRLVLASEILSISFKILQ